MLAKCILASPAFGHRLRWREILKLVKSRLRRWADGEYLDLWSEAVENSQAASRRKRPLNLLKQNTNRALRATQNGKAIKALTSEGAAPADEEVLEDMLNKHPQVSTPVIPLGPTPLPIKLAESTVVKGVKSFPAPGPSGLQPSHLRETILCPSPDYANRLLFSLTGLVNLLASGHAPPTILPNLCGATLIAIRKKGRGLCPIAIGESLTSKCLAFSARPSALPRFLPNQLGVGVKGGCEAIIHTVSSHFSSSPSDRC